MLFVAGGVPIATVAGVQGAAADPQPEGTETHTTEPKPSWEGFLANTHRYADGQYIVDGDLPIADIDELREFYEATPGSTRPESASVKRSAITACASSGG